MSDSDSADDASEPRPRGDSDDDAEDASEEDAPQAGGSEDDDFVSDNGAESPPAHQAGTMSTDADPPPAAQPDAESDEFKSDSGAAATQEDPPSTAPAPAEKPAVSNPAAEKGGDAKQPEATEPLPAATSAAPAVAPAVQTSDAAPVPAFAGSPPRFDDATVCDAALAHARTALVDAGRLVNELNKYSSALGMLEKGRSRDPSSSKKAKKGRLVKRKRTSAPTVGMATPPYHPGYPTYPAHVAHPSGAHHFPQGTHSPPSQGPAENDGVIAAAQHYAAQMQASLNSRNPFVPSHPPPPFGAYHQPPSLPRTPAAAQSQPSAYAPPPTPAHYASQPATHSPSPTGPIGTAVAAAREAVVRAEAEAAAAAQALADVTAAAAATSAAAAANGGGGGGRGGEGETVPGDGEGEGGAPDASGGAAAPHRDDLAAVLQLLQQHHVNAAGRLKALQAADAQHAKALAAASDATRAERERGRAAAERRRKEAADGGGESAGGRGGVGEGADAAASLRRRDDVPRGGGSPADYLAKRTLNEASDAMTSLLAAAAAAGGGRAAAESAREAEAAAASLRLKAQLEAFDAHRRAVATGQGGRGGGASDPPPSDLVTALAAADHAAAAGVMGGSPRPPPSPHRAPTSPTRGAGQPLRQSSRYSPRTQTYSPVSPARTSSRRHSPKAPPRTPRTPHVPEWVTVRGKNGAEVRVCTTPSATMPFGGARHGETLESRAGPLTVVGAADGVLWVQQPHKPYAQFVRKRDMDALMRTRTSTRDEPAARNSYDGDGVGQSLRYTDGARPSSAGATIAPSHPGDSHSAPRRRVQTRQRHDSDSPSRAARLSGERHTPARRDRSQRQGRGRERGGGGGEGRSDRGDPYRRPPSSEHSPSFAWEDDGGDGGMSAPMQSTSRTYGTPTRHHPSPLPRGSQHSHRGDSGSPYGRLQPHPLRSSSRHAHSPTADSARKIPLARLTSLLSRAGAIERAISQLPFSTTDEGVGGGTMYTLSSSPRRGRGGVDVEDRGYASLTAPYHGSGGDVDAPVDGQTTVVGQGGDGQRSSHHDAQMPLDNMLRGSGVGVGDVSGVAPSTSQPLPSTFVDQYHRTPSVDAQSDRLVADAHERVGDRRGGDLDRTFPDRDSPQHVEAPSTSPPERSPASPRRTARVLEGEDVHPHSPRSASRRSIPSQASPNRGSRGVHPRSVRTSAAHPYTTPPPHMQRGWVRDKNLMRILPTTLAPHLCGADDAALHDAALQALRATDGRSRDVDATTLLRNEQARRERELRYSAHTTGGLPSSAQAMFVDATAVTERPFAARPTIERPSQWLDGTRQIK